MSADHRWMNVEFDDRPEKPRRYGVTEMRGPQYNTMSHKVLQDIFETMGHFVDGIKLSGGSYSLVSKPYVRGVISMAHEHGVYVSTGDWAEYLLRGSPSAFQTHVKECKNLGFDTIELNVGLLGVPEETILRYVRLIKSHGLKAIPVFSVRSSACASDVPTRGNNGALGACIPSMPRVPGVVGDVDLLVRRAERWVEAGADMVMIDADGVCRDMETLRADIVAKLVGRLGMEKMMFETSNSTTSEWFIKHYGPEVNLFVDYSQVMGLECLRARNIGNYNASIFCSK